MGQRVQQHNETDMDVFDEINELYRYCQICRRLDVLLGAILSITTMMPDCIKREMDYAVATRTTEYVGPIHETYQTAGSDTDQDDDAAEDRRTGTRPC
jgi:hypothetical protein